jgi:hypothetical protein
MLGFFAIQVGTSATLAKVESILTPVSSAISGPETGRWSLAACTRSIPPVCSVGTPVPEKHTRVTTMLKHLKPNKMPSTTEVPRGLPITPTMQTIVVDRVTVGNPQLASIV